MTDIRERFMTAFKASPDVGKDLSGGQKDDIVKTNATWIDTPTETRGIMSAKDLITLQKSTHRVCEALLVVMAEMQVEIDELKKG